MLATFDILTTKLYPPVRRGGSLPRAALLKRLDGALDRSLTLVAAPAGYGKTTLAADWLRSQGEDIAGAWVSLDEGDGDPIRFFTYLIVGIQNALPGFGDALLDFIGAPDPPPLRAIVTALINELAALPKPLVLVLDDYTALASHKVDEALQVLLDRAPPTLHLILLTRTQPFLALSRMRLSGTLLELHADDLRFSEDEAAAFFAQVMGIHLPPETVRQITGKSEGWIAALQLAGLSYQRPQPVAAPASPPSGVTLMNPTEMLLDLSGEQRHLVDYLMDEVIRQQPDDVRDFLFQTAILDRMCGALCDAVTGEGAGGQGVGQQMLERLERANLFVIPLDSERRWYRYHHLFHEFLRYRLRLNQSWQTISDLYVRAARWFERENLLHEAISNALAANDYRLADELLTFAYRRLLSQGRMATLIRWFEEFPESYGGAHPGWQIRYAGALIYTPRQAAVIALLDAAEPALASQPDYPDAPLLLGWASALRAILAARSDNPAEAASHARRAIDLLGDDQPYVQALTLIAEGIALLTAEQLDAAVAAFSSACDQAAAAENPYLMAVTLCYIGNIHLLRLDSSASREALLRALALLPSAWKGALPGIVASIGLAYLAFNDGDLAEAARWADVSIEPLLDELRSERRMVEIVRGLAQIKASLGEPAAAVAILAKLNAALKAQGLEHFYPAETLPGVPSAAPPAAPRPVGRPYGSADDAIEPLSERELEVLRLIDAGLTNQEIADRLVIALTTVKKHISNLFAKLGAANRTQALAHARQYNLLER